MIISDKSLFKSPKEQIKDKDYEEINKEISIALLDTKEENKEPNFNINFIETKKEKKKENNYINNSSIVSNETKNSTNSSKSFTNIPKNISIENYYSNLLYNNSIFYFNNNLGNYNINNLNYFYQQSNLDLFSLNEDSYLFYSNLDLNSYENPKNIIYLDNILKQKDNRTTLIIRNIPNKYNIQLLMKEINLKFSFKYDILYLPLNCNSNLGFGFINFINPIHIIYFYYEFMNKKWKMFNNKKKCQIAYSKIQGRKDFIQYIQKNNIDNYGQTNVNNNYYFNNSYFIINNPERIKQEYELPISCYKVFVNYFPFSSCHKKNQNIFVVDKFS